MSTPATPISGSLNLILCQYEYAAAHEKFLFALQDKHEELGKYAQRKDASNFVIKKGNQELKDASAYMNKAEAIIEALRTEVKMLRLEKRILEAKKNLTHYEF